MTSTPQARLAVGVIGTGRVGSVLGAAMRAAGHDVVAVSGIGQESLDRAAALLPGVPVLPPEEVARLADLVFLTVPDDDLPGLVSGLASLGHLRAGQILVHTSGASGMAPLEPALRLGSLGLALHPAMTFSGTEADLLRLRDTRVAVTCDPALEPVGAAIVAEWGAEPFVLMEEDRPKYHAALAHGANHLVTLIAQCQQLLRHAGIDDPSAVLRPLVEAALENALAKGDAALTGPVARGDLGTVRAHLRELAGESPDIPAAYRAMSRATTQRALASSRLPEHVAAALLDLLEDQ